MKSGITIGLQPRTKALRIIRTPIRQFTIKGRDAYGHPITDYVKDRPGVWLLWINTVNFKEGTFLRMHDNGMMERVTVYEDGTELVSIIKPEDE